MRRIRGQSDKSPKSAKFIGTAKGQNEILDRLGVDRSSFIDLFSACLGCGARAQEMASKLIVKNRRWSVDFQRGEISFGDDAPRAIWYIGSEASSSRTWLWGYENINRLDERLLTLARDVCDFGLRHGLEELSTPKLALSAEINGHALSAIACGLSQNRYVTTAIRTQAERCSWRLRRASAWAPRARS